MGKTHPPLSTAQRHQFQLLQALEDAITYRRARSAAPCVDCEAAPHGHRCDDHACDLNLIAAYQQTARATNLGLSATIPSRASQRYPGTGTR